MLLTQVALRPDRTDHMRLSDNELVDLLWINAAVSDGINHIHARTFDDTTKVVFFVLAAEQETSDQVGRRTCERAIRNVPALVGWSIQY